MPFGRSTRETAQYLESNMEPNTIAYRWARFQDMLSISAFCNQDWCDDIEAPDGRESPLQSQTIRGFSIGDEANEEWLVENLSPR